LGKEDGVCLISGTGSYCCIREAGKPLQYIGSSGYLLDTTGSGYYLGQQALIASQRELDGRGEKTIITELIQQEVGENVLEHLPVIYAGGRPYIASFAQTVMNAYAQGDKVAKCIFEQGVNAYVESLETAYRILQHPFKIATGGGVFLHFSEYATAVAQRAPEGCTMIKLDMPAVYGSALEAVWLTGGNVDEQFKPNFNRTYFRYPTPKLY
jgi:N-acetylglucosamine kinase-like BadF-type ATPase